MTHDFFLFLATFLASGVEAVEALTIVLALGVVRGWRSPLIGVGAAALVLGCDRRGARSRAQPAPDRHAAARRRRAPAGLRSPVAAQGDSSLERLQGAARRGCGVRCRARTGVPAWPRGAGGDGLVLVHGRVQGSAARRARGRVHRRHVRGSRRAGSLCAAAAAVTAVVLVARRGSQCARRSNVSRRTRSSSRSDSSLRASASSGPARARA